MSEALTATAGLRGPGRWWPWLLALALLTLGGPLRPATAQEPHAAPAAGAATEAGGAAQAEPAEKEESELAVEHGSWFKPIATAVNQAVGFKLLSGYILVSYTIILFLILVSAKATAKIRAGSAEALDPKGLQNFFEYLVEGLFGFIEGIIGPGGGKYAPLVATFFIYILCNNYIAVIPGFVAPTSTLNLTLALGLTAFGSVQYFAIQQNGLKGYLLHFAGSPKDLIGWLLAPLMFILELIGELVKPLSLSMRLFGNIFGEDTVVLQLALLALTIGGWKIHHGHVIESGGWLMAFIPIHLPMMLFSLFGGLIQALVFTMLTCIYISLLTSHDEGHESHGHEEHAHAAQH